MPRYRTHTKNSNARARSLYGNVGTRRNKLSRISGREPNGLTGLQKEWLNLNNSNRGNRGNLNRGNRGNLNKERAEAEARGRAEAEARGRAEAEARGRAEAEARGRSKHTSIESLYPSKEISIFKKIEQTIDELKSELNNHMSLEGIYYKYRLTFMIDGKEFTTVFRINIFDETTLFMTNNCITFTIDTVSATNDHGYILSVIHKNSENTSRRCFNPNLSVDGSLPPGISGTDILQVVSTKLKLAIYSKIPELIDKAKLCISCPYFLPWRLLRGEYGIYEKYGYVPIEKYNNELRNYALTHTLGNIIGDDLLIKYSFQNGNGIFDEIPLNDLKNMIISDYMKKIPCHVDNGTDIIDIILSEISHSARLRYDTQFKLDIDSDKWKHWKSRLQFTGWDMI